MDKPCIAWKVGFQNKALWLASLSALPYQLENLSKEKLALEITTLNEKLAHEANLYEEKGKEFEKIKLQSEEEKIKLERNQQNENNKWGRRYNVKLNRNKILNSNFCYAVHCQKFVRNLNI